MSACSLNVHHVSEIFTRVIKIENGTTWRKLTVFDKEGLVFEIALFVDNADELVNLEINDATEF